MQHFTLFFIIFAVCFSAFAQDDDTIKVDTTIVRLNVGVSDRQGRANTMLSKENFTVFEDGVKQNILSFQPTVTPFSVVLLLDMSGSTLSFRQNIQQSAYRFIETLSPDDRIAVIEFYDKVNLRNDFTSDRRIIANSISVANGKGKTQFYKALDLALEKLSKEGKRRKAIICLTDGIDTALQDKDRNFLSKLDENQISSAIKSEQNETLIKVLNNADAQGVTIFPIALPTGDPKRLADPTPRQYAMYSAARSRMQILADRSGGKLNAINRLEELGRFFGDVAADLRSLYTIEYQPTNDKRDGKFRTIKIEVDRPDLIAKTRQGYTPK
jgi:VWFA-related protein